MDTNRRDFLRNLGTKATTAVSAAVSPSIAHASIMSEEIRKLSRELHQKLSDTAYTINDQIEELSSRIDTTTLSLIRQQAQVHLIFLLLLVSFMIDGGILFTWLLPL